MTASAGQGPLAGLRVVEFTSIGPGPHAAMLLGDLGADVLRIDRPGGNGWPNPIADRGRATKVADIRQSAGRDWARKAVAMADVLIEGMRPGVMERLGLGPEVLCTANPGLIYARMTGWGRHGPMSDMAGHDINYIALTGALAAMGQPGAPAMVPLNLVGDFGGGSMFLVFGILAALWERERSGLGQVVDAAIVDGVASLMTMFTGLVPSGRLSLDRSRNLLGGAAPFYRCYLCSDGREMSVGPLEPAFFVQMMALLGLDHLAGAQNDEARWPELAGALAGAFARAPQSHWVQLFAGSDACVVPVLTAQEALVHPHHIARGTFERHDDLLQAAPAPRFSRTPGAIRGRLDPEAMMDEWAAMNGVGGK